MRNLFFIFFLFSFSGLSQFGFDKIDHDFGDIYSGNERVVDLKFRNTTDQKIYLLRIKHDIEIRTLVSGNTILPDSLLIIRIKYNPTQKGRFKEKIPVYLSSSVEPFVFTIQGNIKEIDNSIGLDCPSFDNPAVGGPPIFEFKGLVLDKETGEPIKDASITFINNGMISQIEKTNRNGKVKTNAIIGLYYFVVGADEYIGKEFPKYVNRNNDSILVYLEKPIPGIIEEEESGLVKDPIITQHLEPKIDKPITKTVFQFPLDTQVTATKKPGIISEEPLKAKDSLEKKRVIFAIDTQEIVLKEPTNTVDTTILVIETPKIVSYRSNNIVFLLDVSSSMNSEGKLDLLKASLIEMVKKLSPRDKITLISYSTFSEVVIGGVAGSEKELLIKSIQEIKASGMTAGGDGMKFAYRQAKKYFIEKGNNQVIMATDGKFNQGTTNLDRMVEKNFEQGIVLTVLGIKNKPEDAQEMSKYSDIGGGRFLLINNYEESKEMLIKEIKRASVVYE